MAAITPAGGSIAQGGVTGERGASAPCWLCRLKAPDAGKLADLLAQRTPADPTPFRHDGVRLESLESLSYARGLAGRSA